MEKLYYSISEAADAIGESVSLVRFWSNSFPSLLKDKGLTLEGAAKSLAAEKASVSSSVKALDSLKSIKAQLMEIKNSL